MAATGDDRGAAVRGLGGDDFVDVGDGRADGGADTAGVAVGRRGVIRAGLAGLGGLAAPTVAGIREAEAAPRTAAGPKLPHNPIAAPI